MTPTFVPFTSKTQDLFPGVKYLTSSKTSELGKNCFAYLATTSPLQITDTNTKNEISNHIGGMKVVLPDEIELNDTDIIYIGFEV